MPFDLDLSRATPVLARVRDTFSIAVATDILYAAGERVAVAAEEVVSDYPQASGKALPIYYVRERRRPDGTTEQYRSKFKSMKQQRLVMALAKQGKIPYPRSGQLGRSIRGEPRIAGAGLVIVSVGSALKYGPYVIDKFLQSHYHAGTWTPLQDDIERALPRLSGIAVNEVTREVNRRLNG